MLNSVEFAERLSTVALMLHIRAATLQSAAEHTTEENRAREPKSGPPSPSRYVPCCGSRSLRGPQSGVPPTPLASFWAHECNADTSTVSGGSSRIWEHRCLQKKPPVYSPDFDLDHKILRPQKPTLRTIPRQLIAIKQRNEPYHPPRGTSCTSSMNPACRKRSTNRNPRADAGVNTPP